MNLFKNAKVILENLSFSIISRFLTIIFMLLSIISYSQTGQKAILIKDILDGSHSSNPRNFTTVGSAVYFTANDGLGDAIWKSYGTSAGTVKLANSLSNPQGYNGKMYYVTKFQTANSDNQQAVIWSYDGNISTVVDTIKVSYGLINTIKLSTIGLNLVIDVDFFPSYSPSQSNNVRFLSKGLKNTTRQSGNTFIKDGGCGIYNYTNFYLADTLAFYDFTTNTCGNPGPNYLYSVKKGKIWESRLFPVYKLIYSLGTLGNRLIFVAPPNEAAPFNPSPFHVYSIGIDGDTVRLSSNFVINPNAYPYSISQGVSFNNKLYFTDANNKIWETDGTAAGTIALTDATTTTLPLSMSNPIVLADGLYFYDKYNNEFRIWKISATGNIRKVMSVPTSTDKDIRLGNLNNELWQFANANTSITTESPVFLYKIDAVNGTRQAIGAANGMDIYDTGKYTTVNTGAGLKLFLNANDSSSTNIRLSGNELFMMSLEPSITNCNTDDVAPYFGYCPQSIVKNITTDRDTTWYPTPSAFDNCSTPSVSLRLTGVYDNVASPTGNQVIISKDSTARFEYTATDAKGNTAKCIFTVKILKPCVPVSTTFNTPCPSDTTISTVDACTRVTWTVPTATDNCGNAASVTLTHGLPSGACFEIGSHNISYEKLFGGGCNFKILVKQIVPPCRTLDSLALVSFYNSTNGSNWLNKWDLNKPINTWYGVTLNTEGCVQSISLNDNLVTGDIPNLNLPNLQRLLLAGNQLTSTIPSFNLPNLNILNLSGNQLGGTIPNFNLPNLDSLYLHANRLSGTIPNFNLPKLKILHLYTNRLSGTIPNFNLPNLVQLSISYNQLSGTIPNLNLPSLRQLFLDYNALTGSLPNFTLPNIVVIGLNNNQLSGCFPTSFKAFCGKSVLIYNNPNLTQNFPAFCSENVGACDVYQCKKYIASSTNSICNPVTWQPYLLRISADRYTADNLEFKETSEGTATLKGTLRSPLWQAVAINLTFSGRTTTATPQKINCLSSSVSTANWAYYPTVIGTIDLPSGTITVNTATHALQIGTGANTQNINELGGYTKLSNGSISLDLSFKMTNETTVACENISTNLCDADTQAPVFSNCPVNINLTTTGTTAITTWTAPTASDNCTATPSVSSNYNSGFAFPVGATSVVYTAKDAKNNTATCSFNVIVTQQATSQDVCTNPTANVKGGTSSIVISGITTSSAIIQIFNASWSSVYNQQVSTTTVTVPILTAGAYQVKVTVLGAGGKWPAICDVLVNNVVVTLGNPCDNDITSPVISNCPSNINLTTTGTTAIATWIAPTASDNCTINPSVSSNYNSGFTFPIGTTNVIYTAKDAKNNTSNCNFNVIVAKQLDGIIIKYSSHTVNINEKVCVSVSADSFFNILSAQWTNTFNPTVLRFDSVINYTALGSRITDFGVSARSAGFIDFIFVGSDKSVPNGTKLYDLCFTAIGQAGSTTLVKQEDVTRFRSEIYKTPNTLASLKTSPSTVKIEGTTSNTTPDIALSIISNPTTYRQWTTNTFRIIAKNKGTQAMNGIKIQFRYPEKTVKGGDAIPSIGSWNEYCSGGVLCYEWSIPALAANTTATMDLPLFILGATTAIVANTTLLASTPADTNVSDNTATVSISPAAPAQLLALPNRPKPSQLIPVVIQALSPNPTEGDVFIEIESLIEKEVRFDFYNTLGQIVKSELKQVKKGNNYLQFDFWSTQNGIYFIQTDVGQGREVPIKFVKL